PVYSLLSRILPPPRSTLFPYTTLFRSHDVDRALGRSAGAIDHRRAPDDQPLEGTLPLSRLPRRRRRRRLALREGRRRDRQPHGRSEEHTSELQSRENLVCRLLLEKKKC